MRVRLFLVLSVVAVVGLYWGTSLLRQSAGSKVSDSVALDIAPTFEQPGQPESANVVAAASVVADDAVQRWKTAGSELRFHAAGVELEPDRGPQWSWRPITIQSGAQVLWSQAAAPSLPVAATNKVMDYQRGPVVERYADHGRTVEQSFVLASPPADLSSDLVIRGEVECEGQFGTSSDHWYWRDQDGLVSLSDVYVYDAHGRELEASMDVQTNGTTIRVRAADLAAAEYPVIIDPQIGSNDLRISDLGPDGDTAVGYRTDDAAVAFNATNNQYLVAWDGGDTGFGAGEEEIWAQLINANGIETGTNDIRISNQGTDGDVAFDGLDAAIAWNSTDNQFLVVWTGDIVAGEDEIYGRLLNGTDGTPVGSAFRISDMGPDSDGAFDAVEPKVAYNALDNDYLVVWSADDVTNGESEIFAQRISAAGAEVGTNDVRLTTIGTDGDTAMDALSPALVWNATANEYVVVYQADNGVDGEDEIFAVRLRNDGLLTGGGAARVSYMGPAGDVNYDAADPEVAWNATNNEYLVVWAGDDTQVALVDNHTEIYGQRMTQGLVRLGSGQQRISTTAPDSDPLFRASSPTVAWGSYDNVYFVVWDGSTTLAAEVEVFGQELGPALAFNGSVNRLSDMGPNLDPLYLAQDPAIAYNSVYDEYLTVWEGDDNIAPLVDDEDEIFAQLWANQFPSDSDSDGVRDIIDVCPNRNDNGDADNDGSICSADCNDNNNTVYPGAVEIACDGIDQNCNGFGDDLVDNDLDGYASCIGDCDDGDPNINPTAFEFTCDGVDQNCNGNADDDTDDDNDGATACLGDCDDTNNSINPAMGEIGCDGIDQNCNGPQDDNGDQDNDGAGLCGAPGTVDCDDNNAARYPGNTEICDGLDNNCNGLDDVLGVNGSETDNDSDGQSECNGDCDDRDSRRYLGNTEICDGVDNNCDNVRPANETDADGDGVPQCANDCNDNNAGMFPGNTEIPCNNTNDDCNAATVDIVDADGDGTCDGQDLCIGNDAAGDSDDDGFCDDTDQCIGDDASGDVDDDGWCAEEIDGTESDCDDNEPTVYPGAPEECDGLDNACTGQVPNETTDGDRDGRTICAGDCDDTNNLIYNGATETCDGFDTNCDGVVPNNEADIDADGYATCEGDCNDTVVDIGPNRREECSDGIDNNCDGDTDADDTACGGENNGCGGCNNTSRSNALPTLLAPLLLFVGLRRRETGS